MNDEYTFLVMYGFIPKRVSFITSISLPLNVEESDDIEEIKLFLQHIDVLVRKQLGNIIGWTENEWHELARLNQMTIFTNSHQPLRNFPKAISYYLNFKCGWQRTNLPSQTHKYKTLEPGLLFLSHCPSLLVTLQNMPFFSICFHSHNLMCPLLFFP